MWVMIALLVVIGFLCLDRLYRISAYLKVIARWPGKLPRNAQTSDFDIFVHWSNDEELEVEHYIKNEGLLRSFDFFCLSKYDEVYYVTSLSVVSCEAKASNREDHTASVGVKSDRLAVRINCSEKSFDYLVELIRRRSPISLRFNAIFSKAGDFVANEVFVNNDCGKFFLENFKQYLSKAGQDEIYRLSDFGTPKFTGRHNLN